MSHGSLFCELAYGALSQEESELAKLNESNPLTRHMSVSSIGELAIAFLISKQALRHTGSPRIIGEVRYEKSQERVDACFVDDGKRPIASFEFKVFSIRDPGWQGKVLLDITKQLDPTRTICRAHETCERYNALFVVTEHDEDSQSQIRTVTNKLIAAPQFFASQAIKLNHVDHPDAELWKFLRVVIFTGTFETQTATAAR